MDTRDGRIYTAEEVKSMCSVDRSYMRPMGYHPTESQRARGKVGRNDPCPCGSTRKFKKCCMWRSVLDATPPPEPPKPTPTGGEGEG